MDGESRRRYPVVPRRKTRTPAVAPVAASPDLTVDAPESSLVLKLERALAKERRIAKALREVGLALGATLDLDQVLELILGKITEALDADRATLYLLDESKDELVSRIVQGDDVRSIRMKVGQGIAGVVAKTGKALHVKDAYADARFSPEWDMLSGYRTRCILAAPMKNHLGRTIGVIQVLNKHDGPFDANDIEILAAIAMQAAVSIDNSRLFLSTLQKNMQLVDTKEALERRVRDLRLLFSLESAMARAASMEELFIAVLGEAMRAGEARAAAVALRDATTGAISLYLVDEKHKRLRRIALREGQGLIGHSMRFKESILTRDAATDPRTDPELDARTGFHSVNALCVPLEGEDGECIGAMALYNKREPAGFSGEDRSLALLIAANASTAIRLQESRESREREDRLTTIGRLLSGVMHDLKTPLSVISGYVQIMQSEASAEKRLAYSQSILKQFDHISAMQREVLEFARGERNVLVRKVYLDKFFGDVRVELEAELARFGIELVMDIQDRGTARFDEGKILRVVHNLARNAQEAMADRGGRFTIRVTRKPATTKHAEEIVLTFSDTGPGIPKEIEHRLFQSFVTSGKKSGTGLGLAIVKKIVEEHSGKISVHSTKRAARGGEQGATFEIRLPQYPEDGADVSKRPSKPPPRNH